MSRTTPSTPFEAVRAAHDALQAIVRLDSRVHAGEYALDGSVTYADRLDPMHVNRLFDGLQTALGWLAETITNMPMADLDDARSFLIDRLEENREKAEADGPDDLFEVGSTSREGGVL